MMIIEKQYDAARNISMNSEVLAKSGVDDMCTQHEGRSLIQWWMVKTCLPAMG
jgi:hypothetical protein